MTKRFRTMISILCAQALMLNGVSAAFAAEVNPAEDNEAAVENVCNSILPEEKSEEEQLPEESESQPELASAPVNNPEEEAVPSGKADPEAEPAPASAQQTVPETEREITSESIP